MTQRFGVKKRYCILLGLTAVLMFITSLAAFSQRRIAMRHLSIEQGLSGNVLSILRDQKGFMWFGTDNGLQRFDGQNLVDFQNISVGADALNSDEIQALYQDKVGQLWVAGKNNVCVFDAKFRLIRSIPLIRHKPAGRIRDQWDFVSTSGKLYLRGRAVNDYYLYVNGAFVYTNDPFHNGERFSIKLDDNEPEITFTDAQKNRYLAGTSLRIASKGNGVFEKIIPGNPALDFKRIFGIYQDSTGNIWFGSDNGLFWFNLLQQRLHYLNSGPHPFRITTRILAYKERVWTGGFGDQLSVYNNNLKLEKEIALGPKKRPSVNVLSLTAFNDHIYYSLSDSTVWSLDILNGQTSKIFASNKLPEFTDATISPEGIIWWIGSDHSIYTSKNKALQKQIISFDFRLNRITFDQSGFPWVSSVKGLYKLKKDGSGIITAYREKASRNKLFSEEIGEMKWQNDSIMAMATPRGIQFLNTKNGKIKMLTKRDGLMSNAIINIIFRSDELYYTTQGNIGMINLESNKVFHFGTSHGISNQSYAFPGSLLLHDGKLLFNSLEGLFYIDNGSVFGSAPAVPQLTSVYVLDKPFPEPQNGKINLPHNQNFIRLEYASMIYDDVRNISYEYRLKGWDADWVIAGKARLASYAKLKSGHYVFELRARDAAGQVSKIRRLHITIETPFYYKWWFFIPAVAIMLFPFAFIIIQRYRKRAAISKVKSEIARDLHDGMGSSLSSISILADLVQKDVPCDNGFLKKISELSRQALNDMDDIVWSVKDSTNSAIDFVSRIRAISNEVVLHSSCRLVFEDHIEEDSDKILSINFKYDLLMILKEALNNAIRHSGSKEIQVYIYISSSLLEMRVIDKGIGFGKEEKEKGNGMANMNIRASKMGSSLIVLSEKNEGTEIAIKVKLK